MKFLFLMLLISVFLVGCQGTAPGGATDVLRAEKEIPKEQEFFARNAAIKEITAEKTLVSLNSNTFNFTINFSKKAAVENCIPTVSVIVAGNTYSALYTSGSETLDHVYSLTLPGNILDLNGVEVISPINATDGCVFDFEDPDKKAAILTFDKTTLTTILVDQIGPVVDSYSVTPANSITQGQVLSIKANLNETVSFTSNPTLSFNLGGQTRTATYASGKNSKQLVFNYTTTSSDRGLTGISISTLPTHVVDLFTNSASTLKSNLNINYTIISLNTAPVASAINLPSLDEDTSTVVTLNYTDAENDQASSCSTSNLNNVTITQPCACVSGVCTVGIRGTNNYFGAASLNYTVSATGQTSAPKPITLTITSVDDAPIVSNLTINNLQEDVSSLITLNYSDFESHQADSCIVTNSASINITQACFCTAGVCKVGVQGLPNYNGSASFNFSVSANGLTSNLGAANLTIANVDDAPVASNISPSAINEDTIGSIQLSYTDADNNNATSCSLSNLSNITITSPCSCSAGVCSVGVKGTLNYFGSASFNYTVTANGAASNSASANFTITSVNDAPVANNITPTSFNEDTQSMISLSYSDVESDQATSCQITSPSHITVSTPCSCSAGVCQVGVTGTSNYFGAGSFNYTILAGGQNSNSASANFSILSVDDAPVSQNINDLFAVENTPLTVTLDYSDLEGDLAVSCVASNPQNIQLTSPCLCVAGICSVSIQGDLNFNGSATFDYTVTSGLLTSGLARAYIEVTAVNDPPVASNLTGISFSEDVTTSVILSYTDPDGDDASTCNTSNLTNITVIDPCSCNAGVCSVGVKGLNNFSGAAGFSYTVSGNGLTSNLATAALTITPVDDAPVANVITPAAFNEDLISTITLSYSDIELNQATSCSTSALNNISVTTPCACVSGVCTVSVQGVNNYNGSASFSYTVTANTLTSTPANANLTINPVDDAPVANVITPAAFNEDVISTITLSYTDVESHQATACSTSNLSNITVTTPCACVSGVCTVSVKGNANYSGPATFNYTVTANTLTSNSANANLTISAVDDIPVAGPPITPVTFNEDSLTEITLGYTDNDGDQASSCNITSVTNLQSSPSCSCVSGACKTSVIGVLNYNGSASFQYTVTANGATSAPFATNLTINPVDDAPVANVITPPALNEDVISTITLNYTDVESHQATTCSTSGLNNITVTTPCACVSGVCTVSVKGNANYSGPATFNYTVTANTLISNSVNANLTINSVDDAPVAGPPITPVTFNEDVLTEITLGYTDSDGDQASSCNITSVTNLQASPSCSCVSGVCKTSVIGVLNYTGSASFQYTVTANGATSAPFGTNLTINPVDDAPVASTLISPTTFNEDTATEITLSYNDVEGQLATSCNILGGANLQGGMTCSCNASGVCKTTVTGQPNYFGSANLNYTVTAGGLLSAPVIANLTITSVDDTPVANGVLNPTSIGENTPTQVILGYVDNDNDKASSCSITSVTNLQSSPSCVCDGAGICRATLTGLSNYSGPASFTYTITANSVTSASSSANLTISNVDNAPVASTTVTPSSFNEDTSQQITLSYTDADGDLATSCAISGVANLLASPSCSCTSGVCKVTVQGTANYNGPAGFMFNVTANGIVSNTASVALTINAVDDAPVASSITPTAFNENTQSIITLSYSDAESHLATACTISSLSNVTVTQACACDGAGVCRVGVTGTLNYNGPATFNYTVTANTLTSNAAPANLTISAVDRSPVASNSSISGTGPVTANGTATSTISITLRDAFNDPVAGTTPAFSATNTNSTNVYGTCSPTDASGVSTCTLKSTTAELKTLSITSPVTKIGGTVQFNSGSAVAANSSILGTGPVEANGTSTSTVTITLKDAFNNGVSGITPTFNATNSGTKNTYGACSVTNASGVSTCTLASTKAEVKTLNITSPFAKSGGTVTFNPGAASATHSYISGTTPVASDGVSVSLISITLADDQGNPISGVVPIFNATNTGNNNVYGACISSDVTGLSTCTLSSLTAENKVLQLTSPTAVTGDTIQFTASAPSAINSTITGTTSVLADGSAKSTVTITIKDASNNPIANGYIPLFEATDTGATNVYDECTPTASGVSTCTFSSTKAEVKTLKIIDPVVKSGGTVTFIAGSSASLYSTITGSGPVVADNTQTSTITITMRDLYNNPVSGGSAPTFTTTGSSNTQTTCSVPNASGISTCTLKSTKAEIKTLRIATPFFKSDGTVEFVAGTPIATNSLISGVGPVPPDGVSTSTVSITLRDTNLNNVSGITPTFTATGTGNIYGDCTPTNSSGVSTCTFASTIAGTKTLSITSPVSKTGGNVVFVAGAAFAANCSISGSGPVTANGTSTSTVTITLKDSTNSPITNVTPTFDASGTGNSYGSCSLTNASGISTCTFKSTKAEVKTLQITSPTTKAGGTVTFNPGAPDATMSTIIASGPTVANGVDESTISISIQDAFGNGVPNVTPSFSVTGTYNTPSACSVTDASGNSTCTLKSKMPEYKTVALTSPVAKAGNTVRFNPLGIDLMVPIEMIGYGLGSSTAQVTFTRSQTRLNTNDYVSDANTYYFEIIATNSNASVDYTISLVDSASIVVSTIVVPRGTTTPTRFRTEWTPTTGANTYKIRTPATTNSNMVIVNTARMIVKQTKAIATNMYIPLIGAAASTYSSSATVYISQVLGTAYLRYPNGYAYDWTRDDSKLNFLDNTTDAWNLEVVMWSSNSATNAFVSVYNQSGLMITGSEVSTYGNTVKYLTKSFPSSAVNFASGDTLHLRGKNSGSTRYTRVAKAGIWVKLDFLKQVQIYNKISQGNFPTGIGNTSISQSRYLWEEANWTHPKVYFETQSSLLTSSSVLMDGGVSNSGTTGVEKATVIAPNAYGIEKLGPIELDDGNSYFLKHVVSSGSTAVHGAGFLVVNTSETLPLNLLLGTGFNENGALLNTNTGVVSVELDTGTPPYSFSLSGPGSMVTHDDYVEYTPPNTGLGSATIQVTDSTIPPQSKSITISYIDQSMQVFPSCKVAKMYGYGTGFVPLDFDGNGPKPSREFYCDMSDPNNIKLHLKHQFDNFDKLKDVAISQPGTTGVVWTDRYPVNQIKEVGWYMNPVSGTGWQELKISLANLPTYKNILIGPTSSTNSAGMGQLTIYKDTTQCYSIYDSWNGSTSMRTAIDGVVTGTTSTQETGVLKTSNCTGNTLDISFGRHAQYPTMSWFYLRELIIVEQ